MSETIATVANPMKLALTHILKIERLRKEYLEKQLVEDSEKLDLGGFVTRMKQYPSLLMSSGLVTSVSFYISKIEKEKGSGEALRLLYEYLTTNRDESHEDEERSVLEKLTTSESVRKAILSEMKSDAKGYLIASALLIAAISEFSRAIGLELPDEGEFLTKFIEFLKELLEDTSLENLILLENLMREYSIEVKRLVEAYKSIVWEGKDNGKA
ncbi:hypothetical protein EYM_01765 [Ignicoccus islandicus DSM 13165]|uniref:CRISPR type III-B/RAMP module-associated protein Cmr5 n=1 Tax=Ignicoccus islandicus DSM 13165 TaxID=940295 RepID=A0A0U2U819_9CREN|nr:type III-B CRISPR module-associated protein Cmr5 [Ignicoccus islandicus]ALU12244.1 hypothetical protein EYM_01765 [Ignicoccus islandicus DSM 13165]